MKPACMDIDEYEAWRRQNESIPVLYDRADSPCDDCSLAHALEMRAVDRCYVWDGKRMVRGRPGGWNDEEADFRWSLERAVDAARKAQNARRLPRIVEANRLRDMGLNSKEVAKLMDCSRQAVWRYWRDRGKVA